MSMFCEHGLIGSCFRCDLTRVNAALAAERQAREAAEKQIADMARAHTEEVQAYIHRDLYDALKAERDALRAERDQWEAEAARVQVSYEDAQSELAKVTAERKELRERLTRVLATHVHERDVAVFIRQRDAAIREIGPLAARVEKLTAALETECEVTKDCTWRGQYHCSLHGVWFRDDDAAGVVECPVGDFARAALADAPAEKPFSYGPGRCEVCGWTLAKSAEGGCVPGNCSYRPDSGSDEGARIQRRREALARRAPAGEQQIDDEAGPAHRDDGLKPEGTRQLVGSQKAIRPNAETVQLSAGASSSSTEATGAELERIRAARERLEKKYAATEANEDDKP